MNKFQVNQYSNDFSGKTPIKFSSPFYSFVDSPIYRPTFTLKVVDANGTSNGGILIEENFTMIIFGPANYQ